MQPTLLSHFAKEHLEDLSLLTLSVACFMEESKAQSFDKAMRHSTYIWTGRVGKPNPGSGLGQVISQNPQLTP